MTGDAEIMTGHPRWYNFLPGLSPLAYFFTGVEAGGAVGGMYGRESYIQQRKINGRKARRRRK